MLSTLPGCKATRRQANLSLGTARPDRAEAWFHLLLALAVGTIVYVTVPPLPLQRPRRNRWRRLLTHDQHRLRRHFSHIDLQRIELGRASIGAASWCHMFGELFGNPNYMLHMPPPPARILRFPERHNEIARCEVAGDA
jgi:hypothetical protein